MTASTKPKIAPAAKTTAAPTPAPVAQAAPKPTPAPQQSAASSPRTNARRSNGGAALTGQKFLNVGIGVGAYTAGGLPLGASFEVGLKDALDGNLSGGGFADYARYGYRWNYTFIYLSGRASYHAGKLLGVTNGKFDPYAGVSLG